MIGVKVKTDAMKAALAEFAREVEAANAAAMAQALAEAEAAAVAAIRSQTTQRTGRLLHSVNAVAISATRGKLFATAPYAGYIDTGTRPHEIRARSSGVLSFVVNGKRIFRRSVHHPGTKARPFVAISMAAGQMGLRDGLQSRVDSLAKAFSR